MKTLSYDIDYLCQKMSDMSGLPIRIYRQGQLTSFYSTAPFIADPLDLYIDEINKLTDHVAYYISDNFDYYGIINSHDLKIIIGPSRSTPLDNQELRDLAFRLSVPSKDLEPFFLSMRSIITMPLDSIIQMLCSLNHIVNGEKLNTSDFQIHSADLNEKIDYSSLSSEADIYKGYNIEKQILDIVKSGDLMTLKNWVSNAPSVRPGTLSNNVMRQNRNTFIVSTTLISRAAIEAGMKVEDSFKLSDSFIQRCENTNDLKTFSDLEYEMVYTYTKQIHQLKQLSDDSSLVNDIYHYILHHISDPTKTSDIADALYISRSHLSTSFAKQSGKTLNDYIHEVKINKAKELLRDRSKSITLISDYLGYSSSSHFDRVFFKYTGTTPKEYRKKLKDLPI